MRLARRPATFLVPCATTLVVPRPAGRFEAELACVPRLAGCLLAEVRLAEPCDFARPAGCGRLALPFEDALPRVRAPPPRAVGLAAWPELLRVRAAPLPAVGFAARPVRVRALRAELAERPPCDRASGVGCRAR